MSRRTPPDLRVLHAVRTTGYADTRRIADRAGLPTAEASEHLLDLQARGWVTRYAAGDGWSLTEAGKAEGERAVAAELDAAGARDAVEDVHRDFLPLNDAVAGACTAWQLGELGLGDGPADLAATRADLAGPAAALAGLEDRLTRHLARFAGYHARFAAALAAAADDPAWITATDRDSCHRVWFELHEDLIATLGLTR